MRKRYEIYGHRSEYKTHFLRYVICFMRDTIAIIKSQMPVDDFFNNQSSVVVNIPSRRLLAFFQKSYQINSILIFGCRNSRALEIFILIIVEGHGTLQRCFFLSVLSAQILRYFPFFCSSHAKTDLPLSRSPVPGVRYIGIFVSVILLCCFVSLSKRVMLVAHRKAQSYRFFRLWKEFS